MEEYELTFYGIEDGFLLARKKYTGKQEREGKKVDTYTHVTVVDGRSQELKDRLEKFRKTHTLLVNTEANNSITFQAGDDQEAKEATIQIVFDHTEKLNLE